MGLSNGEYGQEQFAVNTRVNGNLIQSKPVHDPFQTTTVTLRGIGHALRALTCGIKVQVSVNGSHGAMRAVMSLDPNELIAGTSEHLAEMARRRIANAADGTVGYCQMEKR